MSTPNSTTRLQKFVSYYRPYRLLFWADIAAAVAVAAVSLILPLCVRYITAEVLGAGTGHTPELIFRAALVMLGLTLLQACAAIFYDHMGHVMGARMERDMRNDLFAHYQTLSFSFFDREKTGAVISRITNDLLSIAELAHHGPEDIIVYLLTFIGAVIILISINVPLALGILAFLPLMIVFSLFFSGKLRAVYSRSRERIAEVNSRVEDSIAGIRTVKSFGNEDLETAAFRETNERFYRSRTDIYKHEAWYYTTIGIFFVRLIMVITVVFGGILIFQVKLDAADLISFILYVGYLTAPIPQLARVIAQYQEGISGFNRFMNVMERPGEEARPIREGGAPLVRVRGDLEFSHVSFRYEGGAGQVLQDLSFKIKAGERVALTGPSGVGKTTLCSLIPRFYEAGTGRILLDGRDIRDIPLKSLRQHIGIVQQEVYIFGGTIRDNIAYGKPGAPEEAIIGAAVKANAHAFISALPNGYDTEIGPRGITLSGGQRQRLSIARVFLKDPPVLIFDEATSALDYESEQAILEGLKSLSQNRTSLVIAHRLSTIKDADRILVLDGREIREQAWGDL